MATPRRLTIFRVLLTLCVIASLLLPGLLLLGKGITSKPPAKYSILRIGGFPQDHVDKLAQQRHLRLKQRILQKKYAGMVNPAHAIFLLKGDWRGDTVMGHVPLTSDTRLQNRATSIRNASTSRAFDLSERLESHGLTGDTHANQVIVVPQIFPVQNQPNTFHQGGNKTVAQKPYRGKSTPMSITLQGSSNNNGLVCREIHQVAFVKTHKTGGTTVMNVIQRFGHVRDLVFALPRAGNYLGFGRTVNPWTVLPPPKGKTYDLLVNHVVYNRFAFRQIMPKESVYITIVRHPLDHLESAIEYLKGRVDYIKNLSRVNPVGEYLQNPAKHEPADHTWSFTNNRMSFDLGLNRRFFHKNSRINQFIMDLNQDFKLVMITGHMDESLLLLKRYLCWSLKDIVYVSRNVNSKKMKHNFTTAEIERHKEWAEADYKLYNFFLERFWNQVAAEGDGFRKELKHLKSVLSKVKTHCIWVNKTGSSKTLTIESSNFNPPFILQKIDCVYMVMEEVPFLLRTRKKHLHNIRHLGVGFRLNKVGITNHRLYKRRGRRKMIPR